MRLPDPASREEAAARWWKGWRSVDFSWTSLARHELSFRTDEEVPATLQDYWLRDPATADRRDLDDLKRSGEVVTDPQQRLWHLLHVPLHWDDGTPTWKSDRAHANWQKFWDIVRARLDAANGDVSDDAARAPARLYGVVFGEVPDDWHWHDLLVPLRAEFRTCAFLGEVSFFGVETAAELAFRSCLFAAFADCDRIRAAGDLVFDRCAFQSTVWMRALEVGGTLQLAKCEFQGELSLIEGRVAGKTTVESSVFHAPALFDETHCRAPASFAWNRFLNVTSFHKVRFRAGVDLVQNVFAEDTTFTGRSQGPFRCADCRFEGHTTLAFFNFRRDTWFAGCRFGRDLSIDTVRFGAKASFRNTAFAGSIETRRVRFNGETDFENAVFEGFANLTGCVFPKDARHYHGTFRGTDFRRNVDLTIAGFAAWGAFIDTSFQQRLLLARSSLEDMVGFEHAFAAAQRAAAVDAAGEKRALNPALDRRFGELEQAFQALKQAMANQQARLDEHRFYRLELLARRRRSTTSRIERGIIDVYDATSRGGTSYVRPLVALGVSTIVFAMVFWAWSLTGPQLLAALNPHPPRPPDIALVDALRFSVENTLQPMSVWGKRFTEHDPREVWVKALLTEGGAWRYLAVRLVATFQSLCSIALLFLVVLGFKRHFQMNA